MHGVFHNFIGYGAHTESLIDNNRQLEEELRKVMLVLSTALSGTDRLQKPGQFFRRIDGGGFDLSDTRSYDAGCAGNRRDSRGKPPAA